MKHQINAQDFKRLTGFEPKDDDLERANCEMEGELGHWLCGWCYNHHYPRFLCGCRKQQPQQEINAL